MINIFTSPEETVNKLAEFLVNSASKKFLKKEKFFIALSGGSTPKLFFEEISTKFFNKIDWKFTHLFWGDERCVDPDDPDSNYGMTRRTLIDNISIPESNVHRIKGENDPASEAERYSHEIKSFVPQNNGFPQFDLILLGLGEDGHTASIFPDQMDLLDSGKICETAKHPGTSQNRITITGKTINNAKNIVFLITGSSKADIISKIISKKDDFNKFPASYINPKFGKLYYYLDKESAKYL